MMPNPSQEPPASYRASNESLKDMDVLCTFKIKWEPKFESLMFQRSVTISKSNQRCKTPVRNLQLPPKPTSRLKGYACSYQLQNQFELPKFWSWVMGILKSSDHIHIKIKMPNPSQQPPASSKAQNEDLKDIDVHCTFKIKIESKKFESLVYQRQMSITNHQHCPKPQMKIWSTWIFFAPSK